MPESVIRHQNPAHGFYTGMGWDSDASKAQRYPTREVADAVIRAFNMQATAQDAVGVQQPQQAQPGQQPQQPGTQFAPGGQQPPQQPGQGQQQPGMQERSMTFTGNDLEGVAQAFALLVAEVRDFFTRPRQQ